MDLQEDNYMDAVSVLSDDSKEALIEDSELVLSLEKQRHFISEEDMDLQIEEAQEEYKNLAEIYVDVSSSDKQVNDSKMVDVTESSDDCKDGGPTCVIDLYEDVSLSGKDELDEEEFIDVRSESSIGYQDDRDLEEAARLPAIVELYDDILSSKDPSDDSMVFNDNEEDDFQSIYSESSDKHKNIPVKIADLSKEDLDGINKSMTTQQRDKQQTYNIEENEEVDKAEPKSNKIVGTESSLKDRKKICFDGSSKFFTYEHELKPTNSFFNTPIAKIIEHECPEDVEGPTSVQEGGNVSPVLEGIPSCVVNWNKNKKKTFKPRVPARKKQRINCLSGV
ncbi:hypothetical protein BD770DRAFT_456926 [Pilaira anomala]|nr:hypothetical protein BD770DRAFT_456926 [Pilaira anomala]